MRTTTAASALSTTGTLHALTTALPDGLAPWEVEPTTFAVVLRRALGLPVGPFEELMLTGTNNTAERGRAGLPTSATLALHHLEKDCPVRTMATRPFPVEHLTGGTPMNLCFRCATHHPQQDAITMWEPVLQHWGQVTLAEVAVTWCEEMLAAGSWYRGHLSLDRALTGAAMLAGPLSVLPVTSWHVSASQGQARIVLGAAAGTPSVPADALAQAADIVRVADEGAVVVQDRFAALLTPARAALKGYHRFPVSGPTLALITRGGGPELYQKLGCDRLTEGSFVRAVAAAVTAPVLAAGERFTLVETTMADAVALNMDGRGGVTTVPWRPLTAEAAATAVAVLDATYSSEPEPEDVEAVLAVAVTASS